MFFILLLLCSILLLLSIATCLCSAHLCLAFNLSLDLSIFKSDEMPWIRCIFALWSRSTRLLVRGVRRFPLGLWTCLHIKVRDPDNDPSISKTCSTRRKNVEPCFLFLFLLSYTGKRTSCSETVQEAEAALTQNEDLSVNTSWTPVFRTSNLVDPLLKERTRAQQIIAKAPSDLSKLIFGWSSLLFGNNLSSS